ncbi:MAG TPA: hypothetical protein PK514_14425 [Spirochaetota bacterium]|nr:hypothetical protein [Spirochaetota bacterium]
MKDELNMIEAQILKIFKQSHKKSDQGMEIEKVFDESVKSLKENFNSIVHSLAEKGYVIHSGTSIILTDKGDSFLYDKKLYSDY